MEFTNVLFSIFALAMGMFFSATLVVRNPKMSSKYFVFFLVSGLAWAMVFGESPKYELNSVLFSLTALAVGVCISLALLINDLTRQKIYYTLSVLFSVAYVLVATVVK